jgi:predicted ferric reductase
MDANQVPWEWYVIRASGLVGFFLLYLSVFFGTISCLPGVRKHFLRLHSLNFHCWISAQALFFAFVHGIFLLFDKAISFSLADIFVPFHSNFEPGLIALGVISFYLMVVLVATSYARKYFSYQAWWTVHFLNIALYFLSIVHALYLGTDIKSGMLREIFIWSNGILLLLLVINIFFRIWSAAKGQPIVCENNANDANLRQGDSAWGEK